MAGQKDDKQPSLDAVALERLYAALLSPMGQNADPQAAREFREALSNHARAHGISPTTMWRKIEATAQAKQHERRVKPYFTLLGELASEEPVTGGDTLETQVHGLLQLCRHTESLWDDAVLLFRHRRFARAAGVAISCIEELGKVAVARTQVMVHQLQRQGLHSPSAPPTSTNSSRRKSTLYSHPQKHILAVAAGMLVNSRLDRILGLPQVIEFLDKVELRKVESFRQCCYYADRKGTNLVLPQRIMRKEALFYVVLAGELAAEIGSASPPDFFRLRRRVQRFERSVGHRWR